MDSATPPPSPVQKDRKTERQKDSSVLKNESFHFKETNQKCVYYFVYEAVIDAVSIVFGMMRKVLALE